MLVDGCIDRDLGAELAADLDPITPEELATRRRARDPCRRSDPRVRVARDVRSPTPAARLLDVYRPLVRDVTDAPVLLQVHGGGWVLGSSREQGVAR